MLPGYKRLLATSAAAHWQPRGFGCSGFTSMNIPRVRRETVEPPSWYHEDKGATHLMKISILWDLDRVIDLDVEVAERCFQPSYG